MLLNGGYTLGLKSSQKRERQNIERRARNRSYKSRARTLVKKAFLEIEEKNLEEASLIADELENAILSREMGPEVLSEIDKKQKTKKLQIFSPLSHLWKEK